MNQIQQHGIHDESEPFRSRQNVIHDLQRDKRIHTESSSESFQVNEAAHLEYSKCIRECEHPHSSTGQSFYLILYVTR
jgi:hypothetical protein